tara:strand:+ start:12983 stop:13210 length:228 start_codon:yes stop_codon:yes gene_type:complete
MGKRAMGKRDVAGIGIGSKIHHTTTQNVTPKVMAASMLSVDDHIKSPARSAKAGPPGRAKVLILGYLCFIHGEVN